MQAKLISHTPDPIKAIWTGYRTCYSTSPPDQLPEASRETMAALVRKYLTTSHGSPRTHASFTFGVSGVSRVLLDQFVRHRVGVHLEGQLDVQSQRYVRYDDDLRRMAVVEPESIKKLFAEPTDSAAFQAAEEWAEALTSIEQAYDALLQVGVPTEDARYILPMGIETTFVVTLNFQAMLHICDERLCWYAQWEIRHLIARMRAELMRMIPEIAVALQPKCGDWRLGYCNEPRERWAKCPIGRKRPHHEDIVGAGKNAVPLSFQVNPLTGEDQALLAGETS